VAEVEADHGAGDGQAPRARAGAACEAVAATPSVARSMTIPAAWRSATRLDTVERLRPV
jgi:hypothetical protein